jgi:Alpha galactosidase A
VLTNIHHLFNLHKTQKTYSGIYTDIGKKTCMGYPGINRRLQIDAIKVDGCNVSNHEHKYKIGRPVRYRISGNRET